MLVASLANAIVDLILACAKLICVFIGRLRVTCKWQIALTQGSAPGNILRLDVFAKIITFVMLRSKVVFDECLKGGLPIRDECSM